SPKRLSPFQGRERPLTTLKLFQTPKSRAYYAQPSSVCNARCADFHEPISFPLRKEYGVSGSPPRPRFPYQIVYVLVQHSTSSPSEIQTGAPSCLVVCRVTRCMCE